MKVVPKIIVRARRAWSRLGSRNRSDASVKSVASV